MTLATRQMTSRSLGMTGKILPLPATVVSDLFVEEFLNYPWVAEQKLLDIFRCFLLESKKATRFFLILSFPWRKFGKYKDVNSLIWPLGKRIFLIIIFYKYYQRRFRMLPVYCEIDGASTCNPIAQLLVSKDFHIRIAVQA